MFLSPFASTSLCRTPLRALVPTRISSHRADPRAATSVTKNTSKVGEPLRLTRSKSVVVGGSGEDPAVLTFITTSTVSIGGVAKSR